MNAAPRANPSAPTAHRSALAVSFPVEFVAFCGLHHGCYISFALLHTGDERQADGVVQAALGDLVTHWSEALASSSVAAYAWPLLREHIARHTAQAPAGPLLRAIPAGVSDEVLLREGLQLTDEQIAETTGRHHRAPAQRRPRTALCSKTPIPA